MVMVINKQITDIVEKDCPTLVQASAGTGKTTTLIEKVNWLYLNGAHRLLVLTFSRRAAQEIRDRVKAKGLETGTSSFSTFHSFCLEIVKKYAHLLGFTDDIKVFKETNVAITKSRIMSEILSEMENAPICKTNAFKSLIHEAETAVYGQTKELFFLDVYNYAAQMPNEKAWLDMSVKNYENDDELTYEQAKILRDITLEFSKRYTEYKVARKSIDFNDMEKYVLKLFTEHPNVANEIANSYDYILIDEYQDTSYIQEEIINIINRDNLFAVGDLKQSIYNFRNANPEILKNRENYYNSTGKGINKYLTDSKRSSLNVVNFANDIFTKHKDNTGFFNEQAALVYSRDVKEPALIPVEIRFIPEYTGDAKINAAIEISKKVIDYKNKPVFDMMKNEVRPSTYSDTAILFRNLTNHKAVVKEVLEKNNIPYSISQAGNLLTEPIILSVLSLFRLSVFHADADFLHFFHRGFLGYNDDDISVLRTLDAKSGFYDILNNITNERFNKIKEFLLINQDQNFFNQATEILEKSDFFSWVETQGSSEINKEYVNTFIFWMSEQVTEHPDWQLYDFLQYITEANNAKIKIPTPAVMFKDAVTIATIHSVKGQEFPNLIIAGVDDRLTFVPPPISFDKDLGIGLKYYNLEKKEKRTTDLKKAIDEKIKERELNEEFRILYVAITRAREQIAIIGKEPKATKKPADATTTPSSFMQFIMRALAGEHDSVFEAKYFNNPTKD